MLFLYDLGIFLYGLLVRIAAFRSEKANAWIEGRASLLRHIADTINPDHRYVWFHFASLGEFEQGRTVLEELKENRPESRILITFFSPSGYEVRKNYELADHVFYLPIDTPGNARKFISLINPEFAVFTKYEFWYHYFKELSVRQIPLYMIAVILRPSQPFFKWYGTLHRRMLSLVSHFFVQDENSKALLESQKIREVTVCGDTRFDRVIKNSKLVIELPALRIFCQGEKAFIAGSTWSDDENLLAALVKTYPRWKFVIAPHEVNEKRVSQLIKAFPGSITLTELEKSREPQILSQVLIIDRIGILSSVYQYGKLAYIGGGFGTGIHNTQEALAFGVPVIFGPRYQKFKEARDMVEEGGAISVKDETDLLNAVSYFSNHPESSSIAQNYIRENTGATGKIVKYLLTRI